MIDPAPFFIVGPTAVGKTQVALELAERCGGEVVSADAFQVYEGFDLLTAKPPADALRRVPHHMIGCVPLAAGYSVADYLAAARKCLAGIAGRNRSAIVVGGSGLYVKALTHGLAPLPPAQPELRASLEAQDLPALYERLSRLDPPTAQTIDRHNKRRLVRALEVCIATGKRFSDFRSLWSRPEGEGAPAIRGVFLSRDRSELCARIDRRVDAIFQEGVIDEVRNVPSEAVGPTAGSILGLSTIRALFRGEIDLGNCRASIKAATRQYARRQTTWFKRETAFRPLALQSAENDTERIAAMLSILR